MPTQTVYTLDVDFDLEKIQGDDVLKITFTGIAHGNAVSKQPSYADKFKRKSVIYMPLYFIPAFMKRKKETIAKWKKRVLANVEYIENSLLTELPKIEDQ